MNISEINFQVERIKSNINSLNDELKTREKISSLAFSGNDNWREKSSIKKSVSSLTKKINNLNKELFILLSEKTKLLELERIKEEENKLIVKSSIDLLEV